MASVRYELVPPTTGFSFCDADGTVIEIGAGGYTTDDPRVISELDSQGHAVQRVKKPGKGEK